MSLEQVYPPKKLGFVSPVVVLKEFLKPALDAENDLYAFFHNKERTSDGPYEDTRGNFFDFLKRNNQPEETAEHVISEVDYALQQAVEQFPIIDYEPAFPPMDSKLATHKVSDEHRHGAVDSKRKMQHVARCPYYKYKEIELNRPLQPKRRVADKDLVVVVNLIRPNNYMRAETSSHPNYKDMCEMKFMVRGDMPLMKLREKIFCQADFWCNLKDTEDASDPSNYFMNRFTSSFMFIYDTFYVDDSNEKCKDITKPIREFMDRKKQSFGQYHVKPLSEARIVDLKLRLGFPYIFVHQGHCEHLMIFTDLRLMNVNDVHDLEEYPVVIYDAVHSENCCTCKDAAATFVVTESDRMPLCPAFMCENCFKSFHYDRDMRIGHFTAYHFFDRGSL